jgi:hypothetical protein
MPQNNYAKREKGPPIDFIFQHFILPDGVSNPVDSRLREG